MMTRIVAALATSALLLFLVADASGAPKRPKPAPRAIWLCPPYVAAALATKQSHLNPALYCTRPTPTPVDFVTVGHESYDLGRFSSVEHAAANKGHGKQGHERSREKDDD